MKQVICVHVGDRYDNQYVEKLHRAVRRHMTELCTFTVLHDGKRYNIVDPNFRSIQVNRQEGIGQNNMWWYKMQAFRPDVAAEENLLMDIDIVAVSNLDELWAYTPDQFMIIQDFNRHWYPLYDRNNSSVVRFNRPHAADIWPRWCTDPISWMRKYRGDQDWFDAEHPNMQQWPKEWIMSWKWEVFGGGLKFPGRPDTFSDITRLDLRTKLLVFHGKPDPHDVDDPIIHQNWV
jgi:hypothetical protein